MKNIAQKLTPQFILDEFKSLVVRFPLTWMVTIWTTAYGIYLVENPQSNIAVLLVSVLAFPLSLFLHTFLETMQKNIYKGIAGVMSVLVLGGTYFRWNGLEDTIPMAVMNEFFVLFFVAVVLLTLVPTFLQKKIADISVWSMTKRVLLNIFAVGVVSFILFIGLVIALFSINRLFNVTVPGERYAQVWISVVGFFATWLYMVMYPKNIKQFTEIDLPKLIDRTARFVVTPLVYLFLAIVYIYSAKVLVTGTWPEDGVALPMMVLMAGIFILWIVEYLTITSKEKDLFQRFHLVTVFATLPLFFFYFWALKLRIDQYGLTINRYLLIVFGLFAMGSFVYYIFSKKKSLSILFLIGIITGLFVVYMPYVNARSMSYRSQIAKLELYLSDLKMIQEEGMIIPNPKNNYYSDDVRNANSSIYYIESLSGKSGLEKFFENKLDEKTKSEAFKNDDKTGARHVMIALNLTDDVYYNYQDVEFHAEDADIYQRHYFSRNKKIVQLYDTRDIDRLSDIYGFDRGEDVILTFDSSEVIAIWKNNTITISPRLGLTNFETFTIDTKEFFQTLLSLDGADRAMVDSEFMTISYDSSELTLRVYIDTVQFLENDETGELNINQIDGMIGYTLK